MATIEQSVIDAMNERKNNIAQLIADARKDPLIDDDKVNKIFFIFSSATDNYKYTWSNIELKKEMDWEINTNWNWLRDFLLWESSLGYEIYDIILGRLN